MFTDNRKPSNIISLLKNEDMNGKPLRIGDFAFSKMNGNYFVYNGKNRSFWIDGKQKKRGNLVDVPLEKIMKEAHEKISEICIQDKVPVPPPFVF